jgi:Ninjurin
MSESQRKRPQLSGGSPKSSRDLVLTASNAVGSNTISVQDFPDFDLPDLFPQAEQGDVQNKTLFYLSSSSLNVALMASNVADIMRWVQKNGTTDKQEVEILILLCLMLVVQIVMLTCFCIKMYSSSALQTILDRTSTPEDRKEKEAEIFKSLGFGNQLTVVMIASALVTSVLQVAYKILTGYLPFRFFSTDT